MSAQPPATNAQQAQQAVSARLAVLDKLAQLPRTVQLGVAATAVALLAVVFLWARAPDYGVLFSNLSDRDGGAIVTALTQMNVPYQFAENGNAILIPVRQVHETRLRLAEQGLPQHGDTGFELLDKTRFGASQFTEQVNYQRALEGELRLSIEALHAVQSARVHLAIPRESLFIRDRQAPTASVLISLYPGRHLSESQITAITWLVSSSVPQLAANKVSIVDQTGQLLTGSNTPEGTVLHQHSLVGTIERRTADRILAVLAPLVGNNNIRAQVSAEVDFSIQEQTSESYAPNQVPGRAAVRSQQTRLAGMDIPYGPQGVPGALSNEPPVQPVAPIDTTEEGTEAGANAQQANDPRTLALGMEARRAGEAARQDATVNYELDRTIRHVRQSSGRVERLSAAVVVNYREEDGELLPLSKEMLAGLESLARQAMGFDAERGDTLSVVNSPFTIVPEIEPPIWRDPLWIDLGLQAGRYLLFALLAWLMWRNILRPIISGQMQSLSEARMRPPAPRPTEDPVAQARRRATELSRHEQNLKAAQTMATEDPRAVALVMRAWMDKDEKR